MANAMLLERLVDGAIERQDNGVAAPPRSVAPFGRHCAVGAGQAKAAVRCPPAIGATDGKARYLGQVSDRSQSFHLFRIERAMLMKGQAIESTPHEANRADELVIAIERAEMQ